MKTDDLKRAFDNATPDVYKRNRIMADTLHRYEMTNGKNTDMQRTIKVRKICMVCAASIVLIVGVLTVRNSVNVPSEVNIDSARNQSTGKESDYNIYRDNFIKALRGEMSVDADNDVENKLLAEAFAGLNETCEHENVGENEIIYMGTVGTGEGRYAAVAITGSGSLPDTHKYTKEGYKETLYFFADEVRYVLMKAEKRD